MKDARWKELVELYKAGQRRALNGSGLSMFRAHPPENDLKSWVAIFDAFETLYLETMRVRDEVELVRQIHDLGLVAIRTWGTKEQLGIAQEECAELVSEISRFRRGRVDRDKLAEEAADVAITLIQVISVVGYDKFEAHAKTKLARLRDRLATKTEPKAVPEVKP